MKRTLLLLTCLILVLSLIGCGHAEPDPPQIQDPTETTSQVSTEATEKPEPTSETEVPQVPTETEATETSETTESTEETTCDHSYRSKVTKEPTCSASGEKVYTCTLCGASYKEVLKPLAHSYVETTKAPDCVNTGCTTHLCKECGDSYTDNFQPALGHNYGPWIIVEEPTEFRTGMAECTCSRCGSREPMVLPRLNPDAQPQH